MQASRLQEHHTFTRYNLAIAVQTRSIKVTRQEQVQKQERIIRQALHDNVPLTSVAFA